MSDYLNYVNFPVTTMCEVPDSALTIALDGLSATFNYFIDLGTPGYSSTEDI